MGRDMTPAERERMERETRDLHREFSDYVSDRVFDGKRPVSEADRQRLIARYHNRKTESE